MTESHEKNRPTVRFVVIEPDREGQRIDNFLRTELKGVPKTLLYRILRKGEIRVNKKRVKADYKLCAGDEVRIPPVRVAEQGESIPVGVSLSNHLADAVLYETDALIVINKPSGLAVHGGSGINNGLIEALRQLRPEARFLELVHRLDRDTSGCIMVAKKRSMLRYLHEALREKRVRKIYHALVCGRWPNRKQRVNAPLLRDELKSGERMVRVDASGKESITDFRVLRRFSDFCTLVEASPLTGRTHQIRVHSQFIGHPIVGDVKYGTDADNARMKSKGLRRLMLHAAELSLTLPDGTTLNVKADYDSEMQTALQVLALESVDS
ncbi:23S rRNA pseudouridine(955/2504/2580) synthase RluC [Nitrincola nitratireducens]|uniref:Pseudouridine synthase n=1 Tax=Nitrincola nitratireducens TaxID=1229521 RepID=W9UVE5_9GAMM|nr:23S rRNA pseudouridine(955/2504/2580) synthase RluC [Nitrincola nitratireducens]EXJ11213.1 Ribosomal large subunit pseudouridine synthase C [Nitrincola nitratireducens]